MRNLREIDALVAGRVMGWTDVRWNCFTPSGEALCGTPPGNDPGPWRTHRAVVPRYSTDIAAAWSVVEQLRRDGWLVIVKAMPDGFPFLAFEDHRVEVRAVCELQWMPRRDASDSRRSIHLRPYGSGDSAPEAICAAALHLRGLEERFGQQQPAREESEGKEER